MFAFSHKPAADKCLGTFFKPRQHIINVQKVSKFLRLAIWRYPLLLQRLKLINPVMIYILYIHGNYIICKNLARVKLKRKVMVIRSPNGGNGWQGYV